MKILGFVMLAIILAAPVFAQDVQSLPAPPSVVGVPFNLDSSAGQLRKLPTELYKDNDAPGVSTFPRTRSVEVKGAASAFRVSGENKIVFVYDATDIPRLYQFTANGNKRKFEYAKVRASSSTPIDGIAISVSRYEATAFQLSSDQPLGPGEYALVFPDHIYTFGVDGKK